jgi:SAM-dependent methyltransferase
LEAWLQRFGARDVLDASCGAGRQAIPLAQRRFNVTAADPSHAMIAEAVRRAAEHGVALAPICAGFADLPARLDRTFDAVLALGNGLCHQSSPDEIRGALDALRQCCREEGVCLVGIKDFDRIRQKRRRFHPHHIRDIAGMRHVLFEIWDYKDPYLLCTAFALHGCGDDWSVRSARTREYMLGEEELRSLVGEAGFGSVERLDHPAEAVYALRR